MKKSPAISNPTRNNWLIDLLLLISALVTFLSGIYFLIFAMNGYPGGRNSLYGIIVFFERHTWTDLHIWGSIAMLIVAAIHIPIHWNWIVTMSKRVVKIAAGKSKKMNTRGTLTSIGKRDANIPLQERFAGEQGLQAQVGDALLVTVFYENGKIEIAHLRNLANGSVAQLRDENGHPLWNSNGEG